MNFHIGEFWSFRKQCNLHIIFISRLKFEFLFLHTKFQKIRSLEAIVFSGLKFIISNRIFITLIYVIQNCGFVGTPHFTSIRPNVSKITCCNPRWKFNMGAEQRTFKCRVGQSRAPQPSAVVTLVSATTLSPIQMAPPPLTLNGVNVFKRICG